MSRFAASAALLAMLPATALAHGQAGGPHGGEVEDASPGPGHIELLVRQDRLEVYLTDAEDRPLPAAGLSGVATVLVSRRKQRVDLIPAGPGADVGALAGTGSFTVAPDLRVLVVVEIAGTRQQALFAPPLVAREPPP